MENHVTGGHRGAVTLKPKKGSELDFISETGTSYKAKTSI